MTAATVCRTCGTEPREGARFCDGCGAPVRRTIPVRIAAFVRDPDGNNVEAVCHA